MQTKDTKAKQEKSFVKDVHSLESKYTNIHRKNAHRAGVQIKGNNNGTPSTQIKPIMLQTILKRRVKHVAMGYIYSN